MTFTILFFSDSFEMNIEKRKIYLHCGKRGMRQHHHHHQFYAKYLFYFILYYRLEKE